MEKEIAGHLAGLSQFKVPGKIIKLAKSDHVAWKRRLCDMVLGREKIIADDLTSHHNCRLGKWYEGAAEERYRTKPAFVSLAEPHQRVHDCGKKAANLFNAGKIDEALAEIAKLDTASREVLAKLNELDRTA